MMIRTMRPEDTGAVMRLWLRANIQAHGFIEQSYWTDRFEAVKSSLSDASVFLYEDDGKILGFTGLMGENIAGLFVDKEHRSNGIGKSLLGFLKETHDKLSLQVYQKNERALRFYLREGFVIAKQQTDEATGEREFMMEWHQQS